MQNENLARGTRTAVKRHNAEIHATDAALDLWRNHRFAPADVGHIDVEVFDVVYRIIAVFQQRYFRELDAKTEAWRPILWAARRGTVTLVYGSHDARYNNAVALRRYLQAKMGRAERSRAQV